MRDFRVQLRMPIKRNSVYTVFFFIVINSIINNQVYIHKCDLTLRVFSNSLTFSYALSGALPYGLQTFSAEGNFAFVIYLKLFAAVKAYLYLRGDFVGENGLSLF